MDSPSNVITLDDIDGFLTNEENINVLKNIINCGLNQLEFYKI